MTYFLVSFHLNFVKIQTYILHNYCNKMLDVDFAIFSLLSQSNCSMVSPTQNFLIWQRMSQKSNDMWCGSIMKVIYLIAAYKFYLAIPTPHQSLVVKKCLTIYNMNVDC